MSPPPIPMMFDGEAFRPLPNFLRVARSHYGEGEVVSMLRHEERSAVSHRHFFACVREAWKNLPEGLTERFQSPDALRKHALIQTGHRDASTTVCMFKTEAMRLAATMQQADDYSVIVVDGKTVTRLTAKSQDMASMGKKNFQRSKDDVLAYCADMIGVDVATLSKQQGTGEGAEYRAGSRAAA